MDVLAALAVGAVLVLLVCLSVLGAAWSILYAVRLLRNAQEFSTRQIPEARSTDLFGLKMEFEVARQGTEQMLQTTLQHLEKAQRDILILRDNIESLWEYIEQQKQIGKGKTNA